jgi:hypothetical protein
MKIAIVGSFDYHLECLGFLLEILKEHDVTIFFKNDKYGYCLFFTKMFNITEVIKTTTLPSNIASNYDKIIKLSSNDPCMKNATNIICLLHAAKYKSISKHHISLTPIISGGGINVMFPVYTISNTIPCYTSMITFIGEFYDKWIDMDMINFINHSNYNFTFIINGDKDYPKLNGFKNVNIIINASVETLVNTITNSKFILSRKPVFAKYDRFSGAFALSMSFKKPIIIDKESQDFYNMPGIVYNTEYCEIQDQLKITDDEYRLLLSRIDTFNLEHLEKNKKIIDSILIL